ncbi:hypothetical protein KIN20_019200 [Parelaphostrongylus tenuis]|uniref:Uncharacterized protein n=1 Tax=Parelaphostrongylus tenuis TaxID=148309 RepID=A0AAD5N583_PARTN|nr:hypothetical protein KIN20_019200 [Parelaphostrongylus tenuis]
MLELLIQNMYRTVTRVCTRDEERNSEESERTEVQPPIVKKNQKRKKKYRQECGQASRRRSSSRTIGVPVSEVDSNRKFVFPTTPSFTSGSNVEEFVSDDLHNLVDNFTNGVILFVNFALVIISIIGYMESINDFLANPSFVTTSESGDRILE